MILPGTWHQKALVDALIFIEKQRVQREKYPQDYSVPDYRRVVCDDCRLGFDSHAHMDLKCPKCGGRLVPLA